MLARCPFGGLSLGLARGIQLSLLVAWLGNGSEALRERALGLLACHFEGKVR